MAGLVVDRPVGAISDFVFSSLNRLAEAEFDENDAGALWRCLKVEWLSAGEEGRLPLPVEAVSPVS